MISFRPVTIDDKDTLQFYFNKVTFGNCDFSFSNIFSWKYLYGTTFAIEDNFLFIRFQPEKYAAGYLFPVGSGNLKNAVERMIQDAADRSTEFHIYSVTQKMFDLLEEAMPGQFVYEKDRDWYEYIYASKDLISLVGKKYQAKRNHINKFKRVYEWEYLPITREIIPDCLKLYERWSDEHDDQIDKRSFTADRIATQTSFQNFEKLGLVGGALKINSEILAYSYGQPLTKDIFGIHAEKCLYSIDGGFAMINREFAEHNCAAYTYINREEDLGISTLRQAKLSYHPAILLEKGEVILK